MNESPTLTVGSLFAGIGGFDLAARWMGWRTAWYSEIEPYACAVMRKHFPDAINHGDITQINGRTVERVDLLCGGFPCQDISLAGKGAGITGERSGLWSHYARLIGEVAPRWVVIENVSALRSRGLDRVLWSLDALGYDAEWHCIPAAYVGAPHRRDRIWIVAHSHADVAGLEGRDGGIVPERAREWAARAVGASAPDGDGAGRDRREEHHGTSHVGIRQDTASWLDAHGPRDHLPGGGHGTRGAADPRAAGEWWQSEPDVGRVAHGVPARVDRLRCLGNAIVPQVAHLIFQAIHHAERRRLASAA